MLQQYITSIFNFFSYKAEEDAGPIGYLQSQLGKDSTKWPTS